MEGEQLAMAWDKRPLLEPTEKAEADAIGLITSWQLLLNRTDIGAASYNKILSQTFESLKRIPSLQLPFLEQGQHEDPTHYHGRVCRILNEFKLKDKMLEVDNDYRSNIHAVVKAQYIAGIRKPQTRKILQEKISQNPMISYNSLLIKHRILDLADDYEVAMGKNLYDENDRVDIEHYVDLLRGGVFDPPAFLSSPITVGFPPTDELKKSLVRRIRRLPDPSLVAHKFRDRYRDHLAFPQTGIGVQCDINFSAHLGIHNTQLLRCYSLTDARVKPLVLFIKFWAKTRGINTPYRGTLSSYGYVLMVLHYLTNVVKPFVCPNLQLIMSPPGVAEQQTCNGYNVWFWRDEKEIEAQAERRMLNYNQISVGSLLRGFFEYYAGPGPLSAGGKSFDWGRDVLSLRTRGGLLSKQEKGWVSARTVTETTEQVGPTLVSTNSAIGTTPSTDETLPKTETAARNVTPNRNGRSEKASH
jgi:hypothetical protein